MNTCNCDCHRDGYLGMSCQLGGFHLLQCCSRVGQKLDQSPPGAAQTIVLRGDHILKLEMDGPAGDDVGPELTGDQPVRSYEDAFITTVSCGVDLSASAIRYFRSGALRKSQRATRRRLRFEFNRLLRRAGMTTAQFREWVRGDIHPSQQRLAPQ